MGLEEDPEPGGGREEGKTEDKAGASLSAFSPPPPQAPDFPLLPPSRSPAHSQATVLVPPAPSSFSCWLPFRIPGDVLHTPGQASPLRF